MNKTEHQVQHPEQHPVQQTVQQKIRGRPRGTTKANGYKYTISEKVGRKKIYNTPEELEEQLTMKRKKSLEIYYRKRAILLGERSKQKEKDVKINTILNNIKKKIINDDVLFHEYYILYN